jgi:polygalacturonase
MRMRMMVMAVLAAVGCASSKTSVGNPATGGSGDEGGTGGGVSTGGSPATGGRSGTGGSTGATGGTGSGTGGAATGGSAGTGGADTGGFSGGGTGGTMIPDAGTAKDGPAVITGDTPWPEANAIVAAVAAAMPTFPAKRCSIKDYSAVADGKTDNTAAFAMAIAACAGAGGGHVDVPAGSYLSGAIILLDNIDLHFEKGATVLFSGDVSKYPIVRTRYEGIELMNHAPMIYAFQKKNIAITGAGVLDASATASWNMGANRGTLETWANMNRPVEQRTGNQSRTSFVQPYLCTNVLIQGLTLKGATFWQFHPVLSNYVLFDEVAATNSGNGNNDGLDPESCDHVVVRNSSIKARDDAMAIKSGRDADGRRINVPTSNLVLVHDSMASSNWGMITIGSELTGGIKNVYAYDIKIDAGDKVKYILELKGSSQRGGFGTDIHLDKITATNGVSGSVMFSDMSYMSQTGPYMPRYDRITLDHLTVDGAPLVLDLNGTAMTAGGMSFQPMGPIAISNSTFKNIGNATNQVSAVTINWTNSTINGQPAK